MLTEKQKEYLTKCDRRWNIKLGAVRSGKTFLDYTVVIPQRVLACRGEGDILLLGVTQQTVNRNVLEPMRRVWGDDLVSQIKTTDNSIHIFGKKAYVLGADKKTSTDKIRGMSVEYAYCDEAVGYSRDVFDMLKSRLSCPHSHCDIAANPEDPGHWFKAFIDTPNLDAYIQHYTIDDNPTLDPAYVENIKREYAGTVFYNRYILGEWTHAEGIIYRQFADALGQADNRFQRQEIPPNMHGKIYIGLDFGGSGSWHAAVATMITTRGEVIALASDRRDPSHMDADGLAAWFYAFCETIFSRWGAIEHIYMDSAEQVLIRHIRTYCKRQKLSWIASRINNAKKAPILDRIRLTTVLMGSGRFLYLPTAGTLATALSTALWDSKKTDGKPDTRLDNGTTDIDSLDAFEYSIERNMKELLRQ